ncbi:hypothetical protein ACFYUY_01595 [Kitasatospora sp. NPDC004745]|uniref:hypothetical protein n=1 Tax=Kitasatospora sp. NPDC004745 TaxID=3364019 RepID=UPI0036962BCA
MSHRFWPAREEWAAKAEHYARSACYTDQRVSRFPLDWLTVDQLVEARRLVAEIVKATRTAINRAVRSAGDDTQRQVALDCRAQLNSANKTATALYQEVGMLAQAWAHIAGAARVMGAAGPATDRLDELATEMRTKRDAAARAALDDAVNREIARRNSDEGWAAELERRARIEAGPVITYH